MSCVAEITIYFFKDLWSSNEAGYKWYRGFGILYQIFFEYELLDKFSRADFLPNITHKTKESASKNKKSFKKRKSSKKESDSETGRGLKVCLKLRLSLFEI